jgi:hypothetical protein
MAVYSTAACDGRHKFGERQSQYGEYDADGVRQRGLIAFVRDFKGRVVRLRVVTGRNVQ